LVWVGALVSAGGRALVGDWVAVGETGTDRVQPARKTRHRKMSRVGCLFMEDLSDPLNGPNKTCIMKDHH
jgi:hypothetical protein